MTTQQRLTQESALMFRIIKYIYKKDILPANWPNRKKDLGDLIDRIERTEQKDENYDGRMKI